MNYPIKWVLRKLELAERIVAWSIELLEFDIQYEPRSPMRTQFIADFLAEFVRNETTIPDWWNLYVDSVSSIKGSRAGIILEGPHNIT